MNNQVFDINSIFMKIIPIINKNKKELIFIKISDIEYYDLIKKIIENSKDEFYHNKNYYLYLINKINILLSEKNNLPLDNNEILLIINNYINNNFVNGDKYEQSYENISKFLEILHKNNYLLTEEVMITLIQNNFKLKKCLKIIYEKFHEYICNGYKIYENNIFNELIRIYCKINNINIRNIKKNNDYDSFENQDITDIYLNEIGEYQTLNYPEEKELFLKMKNGDKEARDIIIYSNLKLVVYFAKKYAKISKISILDLIQEGNIGLMKAVDRYNPLKYNRFSTYASFWIKKDILNYVHRNERTIYISKDFYKIMQQYKKLKELLEEKYNRQLTVEEIAKELNTTIQNVLLCIQLEDDVFSYNNYISDEFENEIDRYLLVSEETPEDVVVNSSLAEMLKLLIDNSNLKELHKTVLKMRYRFNDLNKCYTLDEIGKEINLTRQRVYQIEHSSLKKIKNDPHIKYIIDYADKPNEVIKEMIKR